MAFLVTPFLSKNVEVLTIIKEENQVKGEMGTGKTGKKIEDSFLTLFNETLFTVPVYLIILRRVPFLTERMRYRHDTYTTTDVKLV